MSAAPTREQLQAILGTVCPVPAPVASGTQEIFVSTGTFEMLVGYWKGLPTSAKPRLRGLTVSRSDRKLALLLSAAGNGATILLSAEAGSKVQLLREVWPYSTWWEDELSRFARVAVPERHEQGGVAWLRS